MSDHPILFSAPMVRALLGGRKTMTRRMAWRDAEPNAGVPVPTIWQQVRQGRSVRGCDDAYENLAEPVKELDRVTVRAALKTERDASLGEKP